MRRIACFLSIAILALLAAACTIIEARPAAVSPLIDSAAAAQDALVRGKAYLHSGNYLSAADELSSSIELNSKNAEAYYLRAWAYAASGAMEKAGADFSTAISLKPSMAEAYNGRQWCNANAAQWDMNSLLYLYQKLESEAGLQAVYQTPSWDYVKLPQWDLCIVPEPKSAAESSTDISEVYCNLGFDCFKKAQWASVTVDMQAMYRKDPDLNKGNWNLDWARGKSKSWDKVIEDNALIIKLITGQHVGTGFISAEDSIKAWRDAAVKCYKHAAQGKAGKVSSTALEYIKSWEKALNISG